MPCFFSAKRKKIGEGVGQPNKPRNVQGSAVIVVARDIAGDSWKLETLLSMENVAPAPASSVEDCSAIDPTFSDEDTVESPPRSPPIEVVDTDVCARIRFPEEASDEVLNAHPRHYSSGQGGPPPPVARSWCINKFREMYPDAPCDDFDFI